MEGDREVGIDRTLKFIKDNFEVNIENNPDVSIIDVEKFNVANARELKTRCTQSQFGEYQFFIITCENILTEAQNALLKLLEEPPEGTYFIIILPSKKNLLPTILSRVEYKGKIKSQAGEKEFAKEFLTTNISGRIKMLEKTLKDKDRIFARKLLDAIEEELHAENLIKNSKRLAEVAFVRKYLNNKSSSLKMLLEHLSIVI
jgi:DNA polymerase-3 subunit delta'